MIETCKTKLVNKILKIKAGLTASSQVAFQRSAHVGNKLYTRWENKHIRRVQSERLFSVGQCWEIVQMLSAGSVFKMAETNVSLVDLQERTL